MNASKGMMFQSLRELIESEMPITSDRFGKPTDFDLQAATAVLLVHIGRIDTSVQLGEITTIQRQLARHFELADDDAAHVIEVAQFLDQDASTLDRFGILVRDRFEIGQRVTVLSMVWRVVLADGVVSELEASTLQRLTGILGLDESHLKAARELSAV